MTLNHSGFLSLHLNDFLFFCSAISAVFCSVLIGFLKIHNTLILFLEYQNIEQ